MSIQSRTLSARSIHPPSFVTLHTVAPNLHVHLIATGRLSWCTDETSQTHLVKAAHACRAVGLLKREKESNNI